MSLAVVELSSSERGVTAFYNRSQTRVDVAKLRPCLAAGDKYATGAGYVGTVLASREPRPDGVLGWAVSPQWGLDGEAPDEWLLEATTSRSYNSDVQRSSIARTNASKTMT